MAEYVERNKIIKELDVLDPPVFYADGNLDWYQEGYRDAVGKISEIIENYPKSDVVEVKHGEWVKAGSGITERIVCSCCKSSKGSYLRPPFCNQCGAKMDKDGVDNG